MRLPSYGSVSLRTNSVAVQGKLKIDTSHPVNSSALVLFVKKKTADLAKTPQKVFNITLAKAS